MKFLVLTSALLALGCAESGLRLPRLRARGWIGWSPSGETNVGGEVGLVMPLDAPFETDRAEDDEEDLLEREAPRPEPRTSACRVALACSWERTERARALARWEGRSEP